MSMSTNLHTSRNEKFEVSCRLDNNTYTHNYPVIKIASRPDNAFDMEEMYLFPSFEQAKQLHKELSKLMKEIATLEKAEKKVKMAELIQQHQ